MKLFGTLILLQLSFFSYAQYGPPVLQWQKSLGGSNDDRAADIIPLNDAGYIIAGDSYSNDGDVSGHHGSTNLSDGWLVRLSNTKTITWQKSVGGIGDDYLKSAIKTDDGNFIAVGTTNSNDGDINGNHGLKDIWIIKFSENGDLLWSNCYGGSQDDAVGNITQISDGGYIIVGSTLSIDGNLTGTGSRTYSDIWYFKIDGNGNFKWGKTLSNISYDYGEDIRTLPDGNVVFSVQPSNDIEDTSDFKAASPFEIQPWIVKINIAGDIIWKRPGGFAQQFNFRMGSYQAALQLSTYGITLVENGDPAGGLATFGNHDFAMHLSGYDGVSSGIHKLSGIEVFDSDLPQMSAIILSPNSSVSLPDSTIMIAGQYGSRYEPSDNRNAFIMKKKFSKIDTDTITGSFGGSKGDGFSAIKQISSNEYIVAGYSYSNDGDVSGNHGGSDIWIVNVADSQAVKKNTIQGITFIDYNDNHIFDSGDKLFNDLIVKSAKSGNSSELAAIPYGGIYFNETDTGNYTTTAVTNKPYYTVYPTSHTSVFDDYYKKDTLNFALKEIPGIEDYAIALFPITPARPGFNVEYQLAYSNEGTDAILNRKIEMIKDSNLVFVSSIPAASLVSGDTLSWTVDGIEPGATGNIHIVFTVKIPPDLNNGDTLISRVVVDTAGDVQQLNNFSSLRQIVTGSYDPNDKQENSGEFLYKNEYDEGKPLIYTIRFQNTGTDTAFNIVVQDTLDSRLDWNTLEMIASSAPYSLNITDGRYCIWKFADIKLVDSNRNEPSSHGYITYLIKPKNNLAIGDTIRNNASIYFDFNPPIKTNTQLTIIKPLPSRQPVVNGILPDYCSNQGIQKGKLANLPAAADGTTVTVKLNTTFLTVAADSTFSFDPAILNAGSNTIEATYSNVSSSESNTVNFNITPAVIPDVNISANATLINSHVEPVVITAGNVAGGGESPLYTFAKDRNMTDILQAEGSSRTLTIDPVTLKTGENWIFVRMKTSASCYIAQSVIDSIKLSKNQPDDGVDDPNVITVYPNPFGGQITINGLNSAKTYTITLYNLKGKVEYSVQAVNKKMISIPSLKQSAGVYFLNIYDEKEKKQLNAIKLVKQ